MNNKKTQNRQFGYLALIFLFIFLFWTMQVVSGSSFITNFDKTIISLITNANKNWLIVVRTITLLGHTKTILYLTIIVTIILLLIKRQSMAFYFAGTMALANLSNFIIKNLVRRPRPTATHLIHASGFSYPSGHSAGSLTFFALLIIISSIMIENKTLRTFINIVLSVVPLFIGYSRIYLHVHFPSDVLGGYLLALIFVHLSLFIYLSQPKALKHVQHHS